MQPSQDIINTVAAAAAKYQIPYDIFARLISSESSYRPDAIGPPIPSLGGVRAMGAGQFIPSTAKLYGIDPMDYRQAIPAAAKLLRKNYDQTGDWMVAVGKYKGVNSSYKGYPAGDAARSFYAREKLYAKGVQVYDPTPGDYMLLYDKANDPPEIKVTDNTKPQGMLRNIADSVASVAGDKIGGFGETLLNYGLMGLGVGMVLISIARLSL